METKFYSIEGIANFSIGKKFFVVEEKEVKYLPNSNSITCPIRVIELGIKKILLFPDEKAVTCIKIIWDTDQYKDIEDELSSYVYLNKNNEIVNRCGVDFSEKEIGAKNMFHKASIKAKRCLSDASNRLDAEIKKCMEMIFNNEAALDIINKYEKILYNE